ncbi:MAG TPA: TonB-dependent receptor [Terriglobia bacterium]
MRKVVRCLIVVVCVGLSVGLSTAAFAQTINASLSGTVQDSTQALIPGVTITATNTETGVTATTVTNETGVYNFSSLQPGRSYSVSAELPGFRTKLVKDVALGSALQVRQNFVLEVGETASTTVDVSAAIDSTLATTTVSVGNDLSGDKVRNLPLVGNNVLDMINIMPGYTPPPTLNNSTVAAQATLYGLSVMSVNTTMDGISVQDSRYDLGINSATHINPDLVDEIRLIVSPADAETGRGSGQVQILTKSGTNKFSGHAFWNVQNPALNANTWSNNRTGVKPDWFNQQQYSVSFGGPIVKNKTFFFALYEGQKMNSRSLATATVMTAEARKGNFRFFPGIANGNTDSATTCTGATPTAPVVDLLGNPVALSRLQAACPGITALGPMQTVSVYGRDPNRLALDSTGYVQRVINSMPMPNYFGGSGDGLNQAQFRWIQHGDSLIGGQQGLEPDVNRNQVNVKIDHNFNARNKLTFSISDERRHSTTARAVYPTAEQWAGHTERLPRVITSQLTSTLSPRIVNEFRFGFQRTKGGTTYPYDDPATKDAIFKYLPVINGVPLIGLPLTYSSNALNPGLNTNISTNHLTSFADTLSFLKGKHAYKGGVEIRALSAAGYNSANGIPHAIGGAGTIAVQGFTPALIPGLIGSTTTGTIAGAQNLLLALNGSISSVSQAYILTSAKQTNNYVGYAPNDSTNEFKYREYDHNEVSLFFKDDWKLRPSLTINLGVRWEYYGVPWEANGLLASVVGGGLAGGFGYTGTGWADWGKYGAQNGALTTVQFVGKNSTHSGQQLYNTDWNNFGPNVGFTWSLPWFGKDKTALRGGYGVSYQTGVTPIDLDTFVSTLPGLSDTPPSAFAAATNLTNVSLPVAEPNKPLQPLPLNQRNQSVSPFDPSYVSPYVQNFNLAVTRTVQRNLTVDVRWVATRGVKLRGQENLNQVNYLNNGLLDALTVTRAGGEAPLLDTMFAGVNVGGAGFGPVGTTLNGVVQRGSDELRGNTTFRTNIANGNFAAVASSINTSLLNASAGAGGLLGPEPANFITNNPQFLNVNLQSNPGSSIYHSLQTQMTLRPVQGISYQATYSFQRGIDNFGSGTSWLNVLNRNLDRTVQTTSHKHDFRINGTFELPVGPNRLLLRNSSGVLARIVEQWNASAIVNLVSGSPLSITGTNTYLGGGHPDVVGALDVLKRGKAAMTSLFPTYWPTGTFTVISDPQCAAVTALQSTQASCTNNALADASGHPLVVNSQPGKLGNLGNGALYGPGTIRFDLSAAKTVKIGETKSAQVRIDATNVLNHPLMGNPNLSINSNTFGQITTVTGSRTFQGTLRFNF